MAKFPSGESVLQDVKYALRSLRRSPVFAVVAVASIAGGLAAGTGIFAFTNAVMYRPIGVGDGQHLYRIFTSDHSGGLYGSSSYEDYQAFRGAANVLSASCATERVRANLVVEGAAEMHQGELVSPSCFDALRLRPSAGRLFSDDGTVVPPVVISHGLWVRRFGSDPSVAARTVLLNGLPVTVTGVAPKGFAGTSLDGGADFWARVDVAPVVLPPDAMTGRRNRIFTIYARLRDGVTPERAEAALAVVAEQLRAIDARAWTNAAGATRKVSVLSETEARFAGAPDGAEAGIVASALAAVGLIVAIACLNLATMLLARGAARARELSIRLAIGASRGRLLRQLATESLLIAVMGAGTAIGVVVLGMRIFSANRPAEVPAFDLAVDWRVLTFAAGLTVAASLLFGLAPARNALRLAVAEGLKGRVTALRVSRRRFRVGARETLIVLQVAVSIALLLVATLFVRAMWGSATLSPGFTTASVVVVPVHLDAVAESELPAVTDRLLQAAATVGGAEVVSLSAVIPMTGSSMEFEVQVDGTAARGVLGNVVSPGYFETLRIPMRSGRDFTERDRRGGPLSAIVSETFAQANWGTTNAVGQSFVLDDQRTEVIGVVADVRYRALTEAFQPVVYLPVSQVPRQRFIIHARARGGETYAAFEGAMRMVDRRVAVESPRALSNYMQQAMAVERAAQWGGGILGLLQLGLAAMALWGLVAYAVERRTPEMGVRLALGATPSSLVHLMMRPATVLIVAGVGIGSLAGVAIAQVMQSMSVGLAPINVIVVIPVAAAFTATALLAAWWPARRAGRADPATSLRRE